MEDTRSRYDAQSRVLDDELRSRIAVVDLSYPDEEGIVGRFVQIGAAAAGLGLVAGDGAGRRVGGSRLFGSSCARAVGAVNADVRYRRVDPQNLDLDLGRALRSRDTWIVLHANDPSRAREELATIAGFDGPRVIMDIASPAGVAVWRAERIRDAMDLLETLGSDVIPTASVDLAMVAAGLELNDILLSGLHTEDDDPPAVGSVGFYSLHRARLVDAPVGTRFADIVAELARPVEARGSLASRRLLQVGAGGIATWTAIGAALEGGAALDGGVAVRIFDADEVSVSNLNRQILFDTPGEPKARAMARALAEIDPWGLYEPVEQFVQSPDDLGEPDGVTAVVSAVDDDEARVLLARHCREHGVCLVNGGTSATGGQATIHPVGAACLECLLQGKTAPRPESCALVAEQSIVSSNLVVGGLMLAGLRTALAGGRCQNVGFSGTGECRNRLYKYPTNVACPHRLAPARA